MILAGGPHGNRAMISARYQLPPRAASSDMHHHASMSLGTHTDGGTATEGASNAEARARRQARASSPRPGHPASRCPKRHRRDPCLRQWSGQDSHHASVTATIQLCFTQRGHHRWHPKFSEQGASEIPLDASFVRIPDAAVYMEYLRMKAGVHEDPAMRAGMLRAL